MTERAADTRSMLDEDENEDEDEEELKIDDDEDEEVTTEDDDEDEELTTEDDDKDEELTTEDDDEELTNDDVEVALADIKPSITQEMLDELEKWSASVRGLPNQFQRGT